MFFPLGEVHRYGLPDHREGVVPDLAVGAQIVRPDQIARIDLGLLHELVDLDGASGFKRDLLELFLARSQGVIAMEVTYHVALPFGIADDGVAAGEAVECLSADAAVMRSEALSHKPG